MKKQLLWCMAALSFSAASAQTYETRFARPLSDVLNDVAARFQVRLKYDVPISVSGLIHWRKR